RMNSKPQIIAAATSPVGIGRVRAQEWPPAMRDFYSSLFRLLDQLELRYCLLRTPQPKTADSPSAVELTLHPEDRNRLASLIQNLRNEGYLSLQRIPLTANDFRYDFATS